MNLLTRLKSAMTKQEPPKPVDYRLRIKALKNVPAFGLVQGQTYLMDRGSALIASGQGWASILDSVPGASTACEQEKQMQDARRSFDQALADNQAIVDVNFKGRVPDEEEMPE
jgi:hypothetical protein